MDVQQVHQAMQHGGGFFLALLNGAQCLGGVLVPLELVIPPLIMAIQSGSGVVLEGYLFIIVLLGENETGGIGVATWLKVMVGFFFFIGGTKGVIRVSWWL